MWFHKEAGSELCFWFYEIVSYLKSDRRTVLTWLELMEDRLILR